MENINSFLGYFEILDPPIAETSWSLLSLFPFSSYFLFNLFCYSAIMPYTPLQPQKKKEKKKKRTRKDRLPCNRFGEFTYGRSFGQCQIMATLKFVAIKMIQMVVYPMVVILIVRIVIVRLPWFCINCVNRQLYKG